MVDSGVCPQCRRPRGATDEHRLDEAASDNVDWAGLPVNLDFTFSQVQRDKVYAQHLMRKRGSQLFRTANGGPCAPASRRKSRSLTRRPGKAASSGSATTGATPAKPLAATHASPPGTLVMSSHGRYRSTALVNAKHWRSCRYDASFCTAKYSRALATNDAVRRWGKHGGCTGDRDFRVLNAPTADVITARAARAADVDHCPTRCRRAYPRRIRNIAYCRVSQCPSRRSSRHARSARFHHRWSPRAR